MFPQGNFLFIPGAPGSPGRMLRLGDPQRVYSPDSVVLIEYCEPRLRKPSPVFFDIKDSFQMDLGISGELPPVEFRPSVSREEYLAAVRSLKSHIQGGDIYEINYCVKFTAACAADPLILFKKLCEASDAPFRMLARLGNRFILCASPELFLKKRGGNLETKPIKGTAPRGSGEDDDRQMKEALYRSHKDRTENVMAVDVARNDLSIVAAPASVKVDRLYNIETFSTVHQMVSTVSCILKNGISFDDIVQATFPMASMTGAPKWKAMELASKYEGFDRGPYSGTMGIIDAAGDFELPVLIRSLFYEQQKNELWFASGGAITHLSDPEQEYGECLLKAATMLRATAGRIN